MMTRTVSATCPPRSSVAQGCAQHPVSRLDATGECPGYLRAAVAAMAVMDRHFDDTVARPCRLDHHFDRPAEGHLAHVQRRQQGTVYGTKGPNVMKMHTIEPPDQTAHKPVAQARLERHRAAFSTLADSRAQNEVRASLVERGQDQRQVGGIITAIAIHKNNRLGS